MANEYLIPIGFEFKGQESLKQTLSTMSTLEDAGGQVGKIMEESLGKGVKASQELDKSLKTTSKNLEAMKEAGRVMGKQLSDAFKSGDTGEIEKVVARLQSKMSSINGKINFDIPDDKIRIFENQMLQAKDGVDALRIGIQQTKEIMAGLDPNSEEFKTFSSSVEFAETTLNTFEQEVVEVVESGKSMKSQLRAITNELNSLEDAGQTNTARFRELQEEAGRLKDQIGDTAQQVAILASDTKHIDGLVEGVTGLVGAFTAVQGAVGLFAGENEELQEALLKVQSAMALLQGIQAVQNTLNKDSAFNVVYLSKAKTALATTSRTLATAMGFEATATGGATLATKAFSFALKTIGIGLIITAIALLVEYWDDLTGAVQRFLPSGASVGKVFDNIKSYAFGVGNAIAQFVIAPIKALMTVIETGDISKGIDTYLNGFKFASNTTKGINEQNTRNARAEALKQKQIRLDQWKFQIEIAEKEGKDVTETKRKWQQNQIALDKLRNKDTAEGEKELALFEAGVRGESRKQAEADSRQRNADAKKQAEDRRKQSEEQRKQALENEKKANEQIKKFAEELADAKIQNIQDTSAREREALKDGFDDRIKAVQEEVALTKEAGNLKAELILQIEKERDAKLKEFDDKATQERLQLQLEANKQLASLKEEGLAKEVELLNLSAKETEDGIREKYKFEAELQSELIQANEANRAKQEKEIRDRYAMQALKDEEERALLMVEMSSTFAKQSEETELQKQIAIQQIKLDFANQNLQLLLDSGKGENDLEVLRAKKIVQDAQNAVDEAIQNNNNKPFDMMSFLGIGEGLSSEQKKAMGKAFGEIANAVGQITDFMVENYDRQIDKKQEVIDQIDNEIGDLEDRLEDEKQLKEDGFANDVELIEAELAEKQRQKDEEIKQQEEIFEKKKQLQKMQLAMDTATQLSGLITSSVEIFKSLAGIPFVGVPLAIATIATMFGAFAVAKVSAFQAINSQKFRHGGEIGGKRHESGGVKYYSEDGRNIELEDGEFVFKREKRKQYGGLLDAMNTGNFNGITTSDAEVVSLFKELGFDVDLSSATKNGNELKLSLSSIGYSITDGATLAEINQNIKELLQIEKETPKSWSNGVANFLKVGSVIHKTNLFPKNEQDEN